MSTTYYLRTLKPVARRRTFWRHPPLRRSGRLSTRSPRVERLVTPMSWQRSTTMMRHHRGWGVWRFSSRSPEWLMESSAQASPRRRTRRCLPRFAGAGRREDQARKWRAGPDPLGLTPPPPAAEDAPDRAKMLGADPTGSSRSTRKRSSAGPSSPASTLPSTSRRSRGLRYRPAKRTLTGTGAGAEASELSELPSDMA